MSETGTVYHPATTLPVPPAQRELAGLALLLQQLIDHQAVAKAQAEHHEHTFVRQQHKASLDCCQRQIKAVEAEIKDRARALPKFQERLDCLDAIEGVGFRTAFLMLVLMPELGELNRGGAAALAGLAPWTRDSGLMKGKRRRNRRERAERHRGERQFGGQPFQVQCGAGWRRQIRGVGAGMQRA